MLGHGTKSNVPQPRRVETLKGLVCSAISCGAYHTAFICAATDEANFIRIPQRPQEYPQQQHGYDLDGVNRMVASAMVEEEYFVTGDLYTCGLGKAGQLGLGPVQGMAGSLLGGATGGSNRKGPIGNGGICPKPTKVPYFEEVGLKVVRVSAGFHHTLVVAVPVVSRVFSSTVYSFGFGEYGRLGLGHDEQVETPTQVSSSYRAYPY